MNLQQKYEIAFGILVHTKLNPFALASFTPDNDTDKILENLKLPENTYINIISINQMFHRLKNVE